jgi:peroxiredoxin
MRQNPGEFGVMLAALLAFVGVNATRADEPTKPTASASEKNPAVPAAGHSIHGEAFNAGPRHAAYLMPGMGKANFPVTTARPEAQAFVNQGVGQLHSFFYLEAERSFRQAAKVDPDCAMAYWGMAMANVNNPKRARGFLKDARKHDAKVSKRERLYLEALEALHKETGTDANRKQGHLQGLENLVHEFPGDIDARAWLAMVTWQNGTIGSRKTVDLVLDSVMQVEPMHPGAHHYRIHLWDGNKPAWAEKSAAVYGKTAPGIAHAWHMPGHTYTGLKRYADAAYQQEASARVDHAYMMRDRVMPFEIHNYSHNNQWLVTSLSHVGRARDGITVARDLVDQPRDPNSNGKNDGGSPQRNGRLRWAEVLTRYELWDDLIAANDSGALDWSDVPVERVQKAYTLGLAYAAKDDQASLARQIDALKTRAAEDAKAKRGNVTESALAELEGHQLLAKGEYGTAFERFAKATSMRPEALARAHLKARNFGFAESTAKLAVTKQPNQVPPLAQLVEVFHINGKTKEAREAYKTLAPLAKSADTDVPVFQRLAPIVAGWKADKDWTPPSTDTPTDDATADRVDLATLGPLAWSAVPAEPIAREDSSGNLWNLADHKGRNVVVLFFLGGKCAHCMQQLDLFGKELEALKAINTDLVAVSTDNVKATVALKQNKDGIAFPMPILSDPGLDVFKRYRAYDDFEEAPLHGVFLIDAAGKVRYQRISADPFLDVEFVKTEAARVDRMFKRDASVASRK